MDTKAGSPESHGIEEKWWHFVIVGVVLTVVALTILGSALVDAAPSVADAGELAQGFAGASLIEVSSAPDE